MFQEFNYVCSLGFNCHPAGLLKRNGLKPVSYPCDWIMSSLKNLKHFIVDDFQLLRISLQITMAVQFFGRPSIFYQICNLTYKVLFIPTQ